MHDPEVEIGTRPGLLRLVTLAVASQAIMLACAWLLPAASEFTLVGDNISELVLGRFGFIQTAALLIGGVGILALAYALRKLRVRSRAASVGVVLVALWGLGAVLSALFPTDRIDTPADLQSLSTTGTVHVSVAGVSLVSMIVGMFLFTWSFARDARWRPFARWSGIISAGALSLLFAQGEGPLVGLMQRLLITAISAWLILVGFRISSIAASGEVESS